MKRFFSVLLSLILIISLFTACSSEEADIDLIYPFSANVSSYDPQVAKTSDEFLIIENTFEGLIRIDDDGKVSAGVADSWNISDDGLTYTFNLKKGIKWNINTEKNDDGTYEDKRLELLGYDFNPDITANDFVFALRRAVQPDTDCPLFSTISVIKNANEIHNGKMNSSKLGVVAKDDYTLVITLSKADDNFMQTLTTAPAMPCNQEFFEATKGRYGLDTKYTLFNGQFYVDQILETSYLLKNNELYTGESPAKAKELTLKIISSSDDEEDTVSKLESGYYDAAFISGEESDNIKKKSGITYEPYIDTTWAFIMNTNDEVFQSKTMRKAFCQGFTHLSQADKEYLTDATNLIPPSCEINSNNAIKAIGTTVVEQDIDDSVSNWQKALSLLDTTSVEITVITTDYMQSYVKEMLQGIQSGIGSSLKTKSSETIDLTLKVETMSEDELESAVKSGNYDIAFYPFKASTQSAVSFLNDIIDDNPTEFSTQNALSAIKSAQQASDLKSTAKELRSAERAILLTYSICPMLYETSYYACAKGITGIQFHAGTGRVNFVNATKE